MTTLFVGPTHDVRLDITVGAGLWSGLYDRIEVWRSVLGVNGPYEGITADSYSAARVPAASGAPDVLPGAFVNIAGKKLDVRVGETNLEFTFEGPNPRTFAQVAEQLTNNGHGLVYAFVDTHGKFVIETVAVGGQARLMLLGGDAAALLGLPLSPPGSIGYGREVYIPLISGKEGYSFRDYYGRLDYFYRVRFRDLISGAVSAFSGPISAMPDAGITSSNLTTGFVRLVRRDGRPDVKQEVIVYTPSNGFQIEGKTINGGKDVFLTDANGYMEVRLIRGMQIDVSIGGMNLMRRITVPVDPAVESFNMLDPEYGVDDTFSVKRLNIPHAEKSSL